MNKDFFINNKEILIKMSLVVLLVIIALLSIFWLSDIMGSKEFHKSSIKHLEEKQLEVMGLTAGTAGAATILAAIPSDATTPIANQIMDMSGYLLLVMGVIFLEKILLTLTGKLTFMFLIPIACALCAVYLFVKKEKLKTLAIKLTVFGLIIFILVPISVKLSMFIEENYATSIDKTLESANELQNSKVEEEKETEEGNWWDKITSGVSNVVSSISNSVENFIEKGKSLLSNFMNAIAVLLITSCVIPIGVLFVLLWLVKIIFGVSVSVDQIKPRMPKFKEKKTKVAETPKTIEQ